MAELPCICAGVVRRLSENGGLSPADSLGAAGLDGMSDVDRKQRELYTRQQQLLREQRTADQERLLATVSGLHSNLCCVHPCFHIRLSAVPSIKVCRSYILAAEQSFTQYSCEICWLTHNLYHNLFPTANIVSLEPPKVVS